MKPPLRLFSTDQTYLLEGDVSISHYLKLPPHKKLSNAARNNWNKIILALTYTDFSWLFHGSTDLLIPRSQRRNSAEQYINNLSQVCKFIPSLCDHHGNTWATDGSMTPATSGIGDSKSITAAVTGPATLVLRVSDQNASILQGEQMGLLAALVLADPSLQIYTDHQNSTVLIDESRSAINPERRLRSMNGRSYYRWILDLVSRKSAMVTYTKAHTTDKHIQRF